MADRRPLEDLVVDRIHTIHAAQSPQEVGRIEARLGVLHSAAPHVAVMTPTSSTGSRCGWPKS